MNVSGKEKNTAKTMGFDDDHNYYVYEYIYDHVNETYTPYEGDMVDIVKASNSMEAVEKAGFDDYNKYGAKLIENLDVYKDAIKEERKTISKLNKKLNDIIDERDAKRNEFLKERPCPNGCGKMDENFRCKKCGYGFEEEELVKELDRTIKEEKKKGNDVSNLENLRDNIKERLKK